MATENNYLLLGNQLCFQLYAASRAVTQLYRPLLEPLGITYPQYLVMLVLWEEESTNVKNLGERLMLDSGTLTPLLKKLESKELLTRERSRNDERHVLIRLTPKGLALKQQAQLIPGSLVCAMSSSVEEVTHIHQVITQFLSQLKNEPQ